MVTTLKTHFENPLQEGARRFSTLFSEKTLLDFQKMDIYCNVQNAIYRERSTSKKCRAFFSVGKKVSCLFFSWLKSVVPFFQLGNYCDHIFEAYIIVLT